MAPARKVEYVDTPDAPARLDDGGAVLEQVQVVDRGVTCDVKDHVQTAGVDAHNEAGDDLFDDLAKSQGHDGQIVAAQTQDRDTDQEAQDGSGDSADHDADDQAHRIGRDGALQRDRGDDARVGTDAHKARVAQRQVARDADDEVEGDGHDDVGRNGNQLTGDHARDHVVRLHKEHDGKCTMHMAYVTKS